MTNKLKNTQILALLFGGCIILGIFLIFGSILAAILKSPIYIPLMWTGVFLLSIGFTGAIIFTIRKKIL